MTLIKRCYYYVGDTYEPRCGQKDCLHPENYESCEVQKKRTESEKRAREWDSHCNKVVKACQTCVFFFPTVFYSEDEYHCDDELGCFTFWIWKGYCSNEAMPAKFPKFYHSTRSDKICKWYMKKGEYDQLQAIFGKDKEVTYEDVKRELTKIRGHEYEDRESSYDPDDYEDEEDEEW